MSALKTNKFPVKTTEQGDKCTLIIAVALRYLYELSRA